MGVAMVTDHQLPVHHLLRGGAGPHPGVHGLATVPVQLGQPVRRLYRSHSTGGQSVYSFIVKNVNHAYN